MLKLYVIGIFICNWYYILGVFFIILDTSYNHIDNLLSYASICLYIVLCLLYVFVCTSIHTCIVYVFVYASI